MCEVVEFPSRRSRGYTSPVDQALALILVMTSAERDDLTHKMEFAFGLRCVTPGKYEDIQRPS